MNQHSADYDASVIDALARTIRAVDGNHDLGAGALAEALMPFLYEQMADAWADGAFYYGGSNAENWYFNEDGQGVNPYRVLPPAENGQVCQHGNTVLPGTMADCTCHLPPAKPKCECRGGPHGGYTCEACR